MAASTMAGPSPWNRALREYDVGGIRTNIGFFRQILEDPEFRRGNLHTGFIDQFFARTAPPDAPGDLSLVAALVAAVHTMNGNGTKAARPPAANSAWKESGRNEMLR
jgi:acetyl/propionyl-CoA carboxylase alpha subunit